MKVLDLIGQLLPNGTDAFAVAGMASATTNTTQPPKKGPDCPTWPPDLFAVVGTIVEASACYTYASPDRGDLVAHEAYVESVQATAVAWNGDLMAPPSTVRDLWTDLIDKYGHLPIEDVCNDGSAIACLLHLFAIADEASRGMGWGKPKGASGLMFSQLAMMILTSDAPHSLLPHLPNSFCCVVPPSVAVVLPKSVTSSVGCTIRSLSHYLALLPPKSVIETSWKLPSSGLTEEDSEPSSAPYDIRLLLIPFPFHVPAKSFQLSTSRTQLRNGRYAPAYFSLEQLWLEVEGSPITGERIAKELVIPLIEKTEREAGAKPHGVVLPECALSQGVAEDLVEALADSGIEFVIAGILHKEDGKAFNRACTFVIRQSEDGAVALSQDKHHRWRLDRRQTDRYALSFDSDPDNDKWWEDIEVNRRKLPFFGLRKEMSVATLICEDLARTDPAMTAIKAVGPNLVVALLMDGPQLAVRWPGKYAMVLAEDPGSAVLTLTCAAMVDRANWPESRPTRSVGLWRDANGATQEIGLPAGSTGILLTLQSRKKHQSTLDLRSDNELSRLLTLRTIVPLFLAANPSWV